MDQATAEYFESLNIPPDSIPEGTVKLLGYMQYLNLKPPESTRWASHEDNQQALVYEIETEHKRAQGLILRNLYSGERRAQLTITKTEGPFWHNWTPALPHMWATGVAVLVEGSKDARAGYAYGLPQTVAYLGQAPSQRHLKQIRRYCHTMVWVPDAEVLQPEVKARREQVERSAAKMGLLVRKVHIPKKDFGDLALYMPDEFEPIREIVREASLLGGGGYKCGP